MDKLSVLETETSGPYTIKTYDLDSYHDLSEANQERIWKRLASLTMLECLPFGEAVLMEYFEVATVFQAAFQGSMLVAFQMKSNDAFVDPDEPEETLSTFRCPYAHDAFDETKRAQRQALARAKDVRGLVEASKTGDFPQLPEAVSGHIAQFLTGVKGETPKKQLDELKKQSGKSRVNRKTRRSKGKGRNPKRGKLGNLTSRRR